MPIELELIGTLCSEIVRSFGIFLEIMAEICFSVLKIWLKFVVLKI